MKNKKGLIALVAMLGIVLITAGATYAWFSYSKSGTKENTISSGAITFHYEEGAQGLSLDDAMPMTDNQGKTQNNYFEFTITSNTSRTVDIPYYITARRSSDSDTNLDSYVKVYLAKVENEVETPVILMTGSQISTFTSLNSYTNTSITTPASEKALYTDTVLAGTSNYSETYRLRMWISDTINMNPDGTGTSPYNNSTYTLTVNAYGEGNDVGESAVESRKDTSIAALILGDDTLTASDDTYSIELDMPSGETSITKTLNVVTTNPNASVTITRQTAANITESKVKRLSTEESLILTKGINNYTVTVKSEDRTLVKTYNLVITVTESIPEPVSFTTDSWATISNAVSNNNTSAYPLGATREIDLGTYGTHTLRVANKSACANNDLSESSCGFIVEFADIVYQSPVLQSWYNSTEPLSGAAPFYMSVNDALQNVYNKLPSDLRSVITPVMVKSSLATSNDNNLFLLDEKEVFNTQTSYPNSSVITRQLDYYSTNNNSNSRIKKYNNNAASWWLRNLSNDDPYVFYVSNSGALNQERAHTSLGISPAFSLGK